MESNGDQSEQLRQEELTRSLLGLFETLLHRLKQDGNFLSAGTSLASGQIMLLFILYRTKTCKATDIAEHIGITSGAATAMADKLEHLGLISRERSEEDRRLVLLSLTDKGRETLLRIREHRFNILKYRLRNLSIEDMEQMLRIFQKIYEQFEADSR